MVTNGGDKRQPFDPNPREIINLENARRGVRNKSHHSLLYPQYECLIHTFLQYLYGVQ
jgi:hypothetical protein